MKINGHLIFLIVLVFFILIPAPELRAQNDDEELYLIRLTWAEDENAFFYEVIVEKDEGEEGAEIFRKKTNDSFIELMLPPGRYRNSVIPYDYLEKPGEGSQWISFEVTAPPQPVPEEPYVEIVPAPIITVEEEPIPPEKKERFFCTYSGAAWMPLFPFYMEQTEFMGTESALLGAGINIGVLFTRPKAFNIGIELAASWYAFNDSGNTLAHAITAGANLVAQKRSPGGILALNFRAGAGFSLLPQGNSTEICFLVNAGVSFLVYPVKRMYIEIGIDHTHFFTEISSGGLRPRLGIGMQF